MACRINGTDGRDTLYALGKVVVVIVSSIHHTAKTSATALLDNSGIENWKKVLKGSLWVLEED
eukprot:scaffold3077_cov162-Amphora_coffeaeformis.AAC.8